MIKLLPREWIGKLPTAFNFPLLAGIGVTGLGILMLLLGLKGEWYAVPMDLAADGSLIVERSGLEKPLKAFVLLTIFIGLCFWIRRWRDALLRAQVLFGIGLASFLIGLGFAHSTIVGDAELSHLAAWTLSQHDNLTWLGGDIYTGREYEPIGGGLDLMAKDPQQLIGAVPLPYLSTDLGILHDCFEWMGLGVVFTAFKGKGWGFLMVGSTMLMIGAMCTRNPEDRSQMWGQVVTSSLRIGVPAVLLLFVLVGIRVGFAAGAIEKSRGYGDDADYVSASRQLELAMKVMPCLQYDTGMILQQGLYEHQSRQSTPSASYYHALLLETGGFNQQAEAAYIELANGEDSPVRREALRALFRLGITDFNSGQETESLRRTESLLHAFPTLPKARYVRLLLAVRLGEKEVAFECQKKLYTVSKAIKLPENRSYLSSGHQHLVDLAYSTGDFEEAWRQSVYRVQLEK